MTVHDYVKGAFEALCWVRLLLQQSNDSDSTLSSIEEALNDIKEGSAINFKDRLKPIRVQT